MLVITKSATGAIFRVRVQPGAGKNEIVAVQGDALKIKINAPAVKGNANKALVHFLARKLGVKESLLPCALIPTPAYKDDCPDTGHCQPVVFKMHGQNGTGKNASAI